MTAEKHSQIAMVYEQAAADQMALVQPRSEFALAVAIKARGGALSRATQADTAGLPSRMEGHALPVHFIYHLPKCAGQTIHRHLAAVLSPTAYYRTKKRKGAGRLLFSRHDLAEMPDPAQIRVVGGQFLSVSIEPLFAGRELKRSILLRDPVSHFISYYNFRMMRYVSQGLHPYSCKLAYAATQRNFITHYILRNFLEMPWWQVARLSDDEKYDIANAFLASFWYVGDYRLCNDLLAALGVQLGIPGQAAPRNTRAEWECRVRWKALHVDDLASDAIAQIRRENLLDQRLWETWHEARHSTASVRPRALGGRSTPGLITTNAKRLVCQLGRRAQRRWGLLQWLAGTGRRGTSAGTNLGAENAGAPRVA